MGGISMAVKFRHKETGLFFCRAKGLSPSRRDYDKLGEEGIFMKNMNHIELSVELMSILRALNYSCELKTIEGKSIVMDIAVQGELSVRHQKMIEMLLGGFLSEFYWVNGKHHIYIREECKGLLPDDDRYSCLIYEMNKVSSDEERINSYGKEYFFNLGDRFERKLKIGL